MHQDHSSIFVSPDLLLSDPQWYLIGSTAPLPPLDVSLGDQHELQATNHLADLLYLIAPNNGQLVFQFA